MFALLTRTETSCKCLSDGKNRQYQNENRRYLNKILFYATASRYLEVSNVKKKRNPEHRGVYELIIAGCPKNISPGDISEFVSSYETAHVWNVSMMSSNYVTGGDLITSWSLSSYSPIGATVYLDSLSDTLQDWMENLGHGAMLIQWQDVTHHEVADAS